VRGKGERGLAKEEWMREGTGALYSRVWPGRKGLQQSGSKLSTCCVVDQLIFEPERLGLILLPARQSSAEFVIIIMLSCQHPCRQGVSSCMTKRRDRREFSSISESPEGMVAEMPRKKGKRYFNCTSRKSRLHRPILLLSVINRDSDRLKQIPLYWGIF